MHFDRSRRDAGFRAPGLSQTLCLPAAERDETFTIMRGLHPLDPEHLDIIASGVWVMAHPPAPVPTVVLAAGIHGAPSAPPDLAFEDLWQELQREQARVLEARFVSVPQADHFLQLDHPELVVEAIQQVVEAVRDPDVWIAGTPGPHTVSTPVS